MKHLLSALLLSVIAFAASCSKPNETLILSRSTTALEMGINDTGSLAYLKDTKTKTDYLLKDSIAPVMSIRINNNVLHPKSATANDSILNLVYKNGIVASIKIKEKGTHFTFELLNITNNDEVELVIWGPYPTSIQKTIGETVGVVRNDDFAIGIQALNIKTLGGYPWNESDRMPAFDIFKADDLNNMHPKNDGSVLYRVEAARPLANGSSLQAYTRNRTKQRIYSDMGHDKIVAQPYDDGGVIGSKIALFGSSEDEALNIIGAIEIAEGLPHPILNGEWIKTNKHASAAYLITSFTESNVDEAIALTKKAGLNSLKHNGKTFESWGHFKLSKEEFPNGIAGLKECVEKGAVEGVNLGIHCLSNFITTNDPYVTPIPDKRLAKVGSSTILEDIDEKSTEITIADPDFFNQMKNNSLKTVQIGDELIRYASVTDKAPWRLTDCQRGAFNTKATKHSAKTNIAKLLDHPYKVFLSNADLTQEMSKTLANIFNQTGLQQISFDGLEGNRSTGLGTYGETLMPYTWYTHLSEETKKHLIVDASRTTHFFWHIYSRMNWGEPWYAGFRESQVENRFNNQAYFQRNYMPGMLGWFKMTPETSIEDMEWMLAKSAGYDAGYALVVDLNTVAKNGNSDKILSLIGDWEKLRLSNSFSESQKEVMRDKTKEFTLEKIADDKWIWKEMISEIFTHSKKVRQPGEPLNSTFNFTNLGEAQIANFSLKADKCDVKNIEIEINNYKKIIIPVEIKDGQLLKYTGGDKLYLHDESWKVIKTIDLDLSDFKLKKDENVISIDCKFNNADKEGKLKLEIRAQGKDETISLKDTKP